MGEVRAQVEAESPVAILGEHSGDESFYSPPEDDVETPVEKLDDHNSFSTVGADVSLEILTQRKREAAGRRPRYIGPPSTWLGWTREERTCVASLQQQRSQDLSVHLYNAYMTDKISANGSQSTSAERSEDHHMSSSQKSGKILDLPPLWTAWPLPPCDVPHAHEMSGLNHQTRHPSRSSTKALKDLVIATISRRARKTWVARDWDSESVTKVEDTSSTRTRHEEQDFGPETGMNPVAVAGHIPEDQENEDLPSRPMFSSQPVPPSDSGSDNSANEARLHKGTRDDGRTHAVESQPCPLSDDDRLHQLLDAPASHILAKLDDLLKALHIARQSYAIGSALEVSGSDELAAPSVSRSRSRIRSRRRRASTTEDLQSSDTTPSKRRNRNKRKRLGLRDWSDVLGMAALTGWDTEVVQRASEKCATIFQENMLFRTFHEGEANSSSYFTDRLATGEEPPDDNEADLSLSEGNIIDFPDSDTDRVATKFESRCCPHPKCPRYNNPYPTKKGLRRHLREKHQVADAQGIKQEDEESFATETEYKEGILCPIRGCTNRHHAYSRRSKLYHHIRTRHAEVDLDEIKLVELQRSGKPRGGDRSSSRPPQAFYCPVPDCSQREFPFKKQRYLNEHRARRHRSLSQ